MSDSLQQAYSDLNERIKQSFSATAKSMNEKKTKISDNFYDDHFGEDDDIIHQKQVEEYLNASKNVQYYSPRYSANLGQYVISSDPFVDVPSLEESTIRATVKITAAEPVAPPDFVEYAEAVKEEPVVDKNWLNEYKDNIMSRNSSSKRRQKPKYARTMFRGKTFTVGSLLDTYELIRNKEVGDIAITGSLSLFLQGKISRNKLGDLDLSTRSGSIQLDDDFEDVIMDMHYGEFGDEELVAAPRMYYINNVLVDIFPEEKVVPETLYVEYKGKEYLCVDYRHIIDAKLKMLLPRMKDFKELYNKVFELNFI